jgi:uncharacterized protein (TIGR03435 family)
VHRQNKELPVYVLVAGKNGLKLKEAAPEVAASKPGGSIETNQRTRKISRAAGADATIIPTATA